MKRKDSSIFFNYKNQVHDAIKDLKTKGRRHRQIPNLLTLMRLTAPCFIIPAAAMGSIPFVLGLTAFFSLTDLADGFIARKWHLTSELGEILDAVTDKVFASTLLLATSFSNPILLCNLALEGIIASININKKLKDEHVKSSIIGKLKTWFLFSLVGVGIISPYFNITSILNILMIATTAMQVFTIISYSSSSSFNKELEKKAQDKNTTSVISNSNDYEQKKLRKEKILDVNASELKIQNGENNYLEQLKVMREFLESQQIASEAKENKLKTSTDYVKSKTNDFKKN